MRRRTRKIKIPAAKPVKEKKAPLLAVAVILTAIAAVLAYVLLSPSGKKGGAQTSGIVHVIQTQGDQMAELTPADPTKNSIVRASVKGFEPASAQYYWSIDGIPVATQDPMSVTLANVPWAKKGSIISVKAVAAGKEIISNELRIANAPPHLTAVRFDTQTGPGAPLCVKTEAQDPDGDDIRYEYEWTVNGAPAGKTDRLDQKVRRGDRIMVRVIPLDAEARGDEQTVERVIENMPPEIAESKEFRFEKDVFEYQVKASDPDGDPLVFALESSPPGMTIDANTGLVRWQVPREVSGRQRMSIVVTDGQGGRTKYDLDFVLQ